MLVMLALSSARLLHNLPPELAAMLALAAQRIESLPADARDVGSLCPGCFTVSLLMLTMLAPVFWLIDKSTC